MEYPAYITKDEDCFLVNFPDLEGCLTYGDTIEEAKDNAKEALNGCLMVLVESKIDFLQPSDLKGDNVYYIPVEKAVEHSINLSKRRKELNLT